MFMYARITNVEVRRSFILYYSMLEFQRLNFFAYLIFLCTNECELLIQTSNTGGIMVYK